MQKIYPFTLRVKFENIYFSNYSGIPEFSQIFKQDLFKNWDSLYARLNSHYKAWSYRKRSTKILKHTENLFRKNLQLKGVC